METAMLKVKEMIDANTIIGEPISTVDGITLVPVSRISLGFVGGGMDSTSKPEPKDSFGGGIGAGVKVEPVAFAVIKDNETKLLYIAPPTPSTFDKVIDAVPDVVETITKLISKDKSQDDE